jgi:hypothetical protein
MAMAQRGLGLLRRSLGLGPLSTQRALSSTSPAASAEGGAAAEAAKESKGRKKKKNLFDVVQFLPSWGVGYKVAKTTWRDVSYQITKINLYKVSAPPFSDTFRIISVASCDFVIFGMQDGRHGKAWGIRYKAG